MSHTDYKFEEACRKFHDIRRRQGFTTTDWYNLEERNREQYREALRAALEEYNAKDRQKEI